VSNKCDTPADAPLVDPLAHLGRAAGPSFIEILDVVHDYPTIYACTSVKGLNIWDASGVGPPTQIATGIAPPGLAGKGGNLPHCQHVGLDKETKLLAMTNRGDEIQPQPFIAVTDVSDPANLQGRAVWTGPESIEGVAVEGDRVYAAAHSAGIMVFQIGASELTEVGRFTDAESDAWLPLKMGEHLLVAEGNRGLTVYDVSTDTPALIATVAIDGSSKDVVVHEGVAYVAASSRVAAVDVSDPANPSMLGEIETQGTAVTLAIGMNDTLLVAEWEKLRGYDISDPANMTQELSEVVPTTDNAAFSRLLAIDAAPEQALVFPGEWSGLHAYQQTPCGVGPDIESSPDHVSFPTVAPQASEVRAVIIDNQGNRPLNITSIASDNPTISVNETQLVIEPASAAALEVTFTPTSTAAMHATLSFVSDDVDQNPFTLGLSGNIPGVDVGDPLPTFDLVDTEGTAWSNSDLDGKVAVLAYFATF